MDITRLSIPDALFTSQVNAFLIKDSPITLIDTGPNTKAAFEALMRGLEKEGQGIKDIKRVVLTHSHLDHCGLIQEIQNASGAAVLASTEVKPWIDEYNKQWGSEIQKIMKLLSEYGIPRSYITATVMMVRQYKKLGSAGRVDVTLEPGDRIEFDDFELEVLSTPGHSHRCISLFQPEERILFCGDLLMENPTSHPLMQPTSGDPGDWPNQVILIRESLDYVCSLDPELAFCGHGEPVTSVNAVREKIRERHIEKQRRILRLLEDGAKNLFQINQKVNTFKPPVEQFIEIFETLHHLNILRSQMAIKEEGHIFSLP